MKDLAVDREKNPSAAASDRWDPSTEEGDDDDDDVPVPVADRPKEILPLGFPATIPECTEIRFFASGGRDDDGGPCGVNVDCRA